jgi:succinate dehydrogenase / fumarate reductase, flavoprotein subunit
MSGWREAGTIMTPVASNGAAAAPAHIETDVLVIGAGGAGMYAALEAARTGAAVVLVDRSLIGRGGGPGHATK